MNAAAASVRRLHLVRAPAGDIPSLDWQGRELDCSACTHQPQRAEIGCEPGHSCMQDAYARRIDRFFRAHPELALQHLDHPYFEVRAIAARHVDPFHVGALRDDPDETVRLQVALRVPQRQLVVMCADPHREVRIRVAQRLADDQLGRLIGDPDYEVRTVVARRLPLALLPLLARDPEVQVRRVLAERMEMPALWQLADDESAWVRRLVAERVPPALVERFRADADWSVRWQVADRADARRQMRLLNELAQDPDPEVALRARERLDETPLAAVKEPEHG